jgi:hypothetical protein
MRLKPLTLVLALGCLGAVSACTRSSSTNAGAPAAPVPVTTLEVTNQDFLDMDIYVISAPIGTRLRLGTARGNTTTKLTIPEGVLLSGGTPLKFLADPVGRTRTSVSSSIVVNRGDIVTLRIPPG